MGIPLSASRGRRRPTSRRPSRHPTRPRSPPHAPGILADQDLVTVRGTRSAPIVGPRGHPAPTQARSAAAPLSGASTPGRVNTTSRSAISIARRSPASKRLVKAPQALHVLLRHRPSSIAISRGVAASHAKQKSRRGTALVPTTTANASRSSTTVDSMGREGRSGTHPRRLPAGWGSKGRWFKSSRPDSYRRASAAQTARTSARLRAGRISSVNWIVIVKVAERLPFGVEAANCVYPAGIEPVWPTTVPQRVR